MTKKRVFVFPKTARLGVGLLGAFLLGSLLWGVMVDQFAFPWPRRAEVLSPGSQFPGAGSFGETAGDLAPSAIQRNDPAIPGYHFAVASKRELSELNDRLRGRVRSSETIATKEICRQLTHQTFLSLAHRDNRRIDWDENYLQWLAGLIYSEAGRVQLSDQVLNGQAALCSKACRVLADQLHRFDDNGQPIATRLVGLSGHVVLEVQCQERWFLADPDFGIFVEASVQELAQDFSPAAAALAERGFNSESIELYRDCLVSTDDNETKPVGQPLSPRLYALAWHTRWLAWVIPGVLIGIAVFFRRRLRT